MNDMKSKLGIDFNQVEHARSVARKIADGVQDFVEGYTTVAVERTLCRLIGIDGVDANAVPLPNVVVEELREKNVLGEGALFFLGNAIVETGLTPQQIAEEIAAGKLDTTRSAVCTAAEREAALKPYIDASIAKIAANRQRRENYIATIGEGPRPYLYVIVATGNIYEDVVQAQAAARQGADIIAVIRTTGQSLLDYVPYGATTEGFGGTFATQENFRIMRKALDEVGEEVGRYIRLCNYCSGLCMPEIAVMGALEGLDVMLNDALYGILFRDINMQRTLVDQYMSRVINGFAGVIINTGEDNYLTTADAVEEAHTVLASDLINEQLALLAGLPEEQMGLGHAFEMDPMLENGFLYELAQAQIEALEQRTRDAESRRTSLEESLAALAARSGACRAEIEAIVKNPAKPSFHNTIVALERSGEAKQDSLEALGLLQTGENAKAVAALLQQQLAAPTPHDAVRERFQHWLAPRLGGSARCAQRLLDEMK